MAHPFNSPLEIQEVYRAISVFEIVVVDLDGPILDGMQRHYRCYGDILLEHGAVPVPLRSYWDLKRDRVSRRELLALSNAVGLYDEFLKLWIERIELKEYLELDRLQECAVDTLSDWKQSGVRLVLATLRNNPVNLEWQLARLELSFLFDKVVVVGTGKDGANKAAEVRPFLGELNLDNTIWIGDTEVDINAARELGVKVCALTCGLRSRAYLASLAPDFLEPSLKSFAEKIFTE